MSKLGAGFRAYLISQATVQSVVAGRIYPLRLPQNPTFPAVTYTNIMSERPETMTGGTGLVRSRLQVDSWGQTKEAAEDLAARIRKVLQGFRGAFGSGATLVNVQAVHYVSDFEMYDPDVNNYRVIKDYHIWFEEDRPII